MSDLKIIPECSGPERLESIDGVTFFVMCSEHQSLLDIHLSFTDFTKISPRFHIEIPSNRPVFEPLAISSEIAYYR